MALDTVLIAQSSPDNVQPFAELGLKADEYARIKEILGRRPTSSELAMYSVMWSEHCSYKSSKVHLKQFGEKAPKSDALLVGIGENAGVVDVGQGYAVTFKIESHNHPSFIEPYQGAATGVVIESKIDKGKGPVSTILITNGVLKKTDHFVRTAKYYYSVDINSITVLTVRSLPKLNNSQETIK